MATDRAGTSQAPAPRDAAARWTREQRAPLSAEAIVRAALAIADADGVDERTAVAMVMATDDYTFGHVRRRRAFGAAGPLGGPGEDTFDLGLEWLLDGMAATLGD
jgi:hypothetical protein